MSCQEGKQHLCEVVGGSLMWWQHIWVLGELA